MVTVISWYLSFFKFSALSATVPTVSPIRAAYEGANIIITCKDRWLFALESGVFLLYFFTNAGISIQRIFLMKYSGLLWLIS